MPAHRLIINLSIMRNPYSQSNVKLSSIHPFPWTTPVYHTIFLARHSVPILWHNNTLLNWCQSCHIIPQSDRFYHFTIVANPSLPLFLLSSKPQHPLCLSIPVTQPETTLSLNTIPSSTQTTSCPPFHAFPHLVHNWFDSKDTCVKYVLSSQTIHKSIQIFSVLLVPSPTHLYTSSIPTCLYSTTPSPSPCRFIHQLFKVSSSQSGHAPILPPLNPAPLQTTHVHHCQGLWFFLSSM